MCAPQNQPWRSTPTLFQVIRRMTREFWSHWNLYPSKSKDSNFGPIADIIYHYWILIGQLHEQNGEALNAGIKFREGAEECQILEQEYAVEEESRSSRVKAQPGLSTPPESLCLEINSPVSTREFVISAVWSSVCITASIVVSKCMNLDALIAATLAVSNIKVNDEEIVWAGEMAALSCISCTIKTRKLLWINGISRRAESD